MRRFIIRTLAGLALAIVAGVGYLLIPTKHVIEVLNSSSEPLRGLVIVLKDHREPVPEILPQQSTKVIFRKNAEGTYEFLALRDNQLISVGTCGYSGIFTNRYRVNFSGSPPVLTQCDYK